MTTLAQLHNVSQRFGAIQALNDVSLSIESNSIVGLLGPNGAGKSTIISLLEGLRPPTSGTVELFGGSPRDYRSRRLLGCTPQETALPETLRVGEVIDFVGKHFEKPTPTTELAEEFGLSDLMKRQTGSLSGGQKRRLSVALAFVGRPALVLLDEPSTGLDVDARHTLWQVLREQHASGVTVVVTSHYLEEIEALAERVVVVDGGRVIADDSLPAILARVGLRKMRLATPQAERVAALPGIVRHEAEAGGFTTFYAQDSDAALVQIVQSGIPFSDLTVRGASLEEAFLTITDASEAPQHRTTKDAES